MIPVFSLVAYSGSGKTTFLEKLIPELKRRGFRVAVVKHDGHDFEIDRPGKDTWRMTQAGADVTAILSKTHAAVMENRPLPLEELIGRIQNVDLILTEGFKHGPWPKIMLYRLGAGRPVPLPPEECWAVVSDVDLPGDCPRFGLEDANGVADLLSAELRRTEDG